MKKKGVCGNKIISGIFLCILLTIWYMPDLGYEQNSPEKQEKQEKQESIDTSLKDTTLKKVEIVSVIKNEIKKTDNKITKNNIEEKLTLHKLAQDFHTYADNKLAKKNNNDLSITERRFLEKIMSCMQTSFFINKQTLLSHIGSEKSVDIFIELNRNGFVEGLCVSKTSKDTLFDVCIKNMVEEASKAFPPIPQLIEKIPYRFVLRISFEYGISMQILLPR